jgi:riboflavin transporter FmnP
MRSYEITAAAALAAISAVLQFVHLGFLTPWGMWIDLVAVSWIVAYFIYGPRVALTVSIAGALIITLIAPTSWLGAVMKWTASVPLILTLFIVQNGMKAKQKDLAKARYLLIAVAGALLIRCSLMVPLNYYFAIPIWTGMSVPELEMAFGPVLLGFPMWFWIVAVNVAQGILEAALAWVLVYRFRLDRFSSWE